MEIDNRSAFGAGNAKLETSDGWSIIGEIILRHSVQAALMNSSQVYQVFSSPKSLNV